MSSVKGWDEHRHTAALAVTHAVHLLLASFQLRILSVQLVQQLFEINKHKRSSGQIFTGVTDAENLLRLNAPSGTGSGALVTEDRQDSCSCWVSRGGGGTYRTAFNSHAKSNIMLYVNIGNQIFFSCILCLVYLLFYFSVTSAASFQDKNKTKQKNVGDRHGPVNTLPETQTSPLLLLWSDILVLVIDPI